MGVAESIARPRLDHRARRSRTRNPHKSRTRGEKCCDGAGLAWRAGLAIARAGMVS